MKHQKVIKIKHETKRSKTMDKYSLMKMFHCGHRRQVYTYAFVYVDPEIMPEKDYFLNTKTFVDNYKIISTPGPFLKHWLGFNYICSEDYGLDKNFDETDMKSQSYL